MFLHLCYGEKKLSKSEKSAGKRVGLTVFVRVNKKLQNERLTQTTHVQKNGRLSDVDDVALVCEREALADGIHRGRAAP